MHIRNTSLALVTFTVLVGLSGCGLGPASGTGNTVAPLTETGITGRVHGGNQPVSGANIQLWAVGSTGYGSGASSILTNPVTTGSDGSFSLTNDYTCPANNPEVYITSSGGNPGLTSGTNNSALLLMAALTDCNTLKANAASEFISINEVTTVASAYALAQFISPSSSLTTINIGAYGYSNQGLLNAFATVNNLVNTTTGAALTTTPNGNGLVPQTELNTLGNILSSCVNSDGTGTSPCPALMSATGTASGGNTLQAALNIALNPGNNVYNICNLASTNPAFQPSLACVPGTTPHDWSLALSFATGGSYAKSMAFDSIGNLWIANYGSGNATSTLSMVNPLGVPASNSPYSNSGFLYGAWGLAIDTNNNVWVTSHDTNGSVTGSAAEFNAGYSGSNYYINTAYGPLTGIGLNAPEGVAIDQSNDVWIVNNGNNTVSEVENGTTQSNSGYSGGGLSSPQSIAIDESGNAWVANNGNGTVTEIAPGGVPVSASNGYTASGTAGPVTIVSIAMDGSNNAWVTDSGSSTVAQLSSSGTLVSASDSANGVTPLKAIAVDGSGNKWIAGGNGLAELNGSGTAVSPSGGYETETSPSSINQPSSMAIDASGNVWVGNSSPKSVSGKSITVTEFVGLASPTVMPLAAAVGQSQIGAKPGTPIHVSIATTTLPEYSDSVAYSARVYAQGGNSGNFTWNITGLPASASYTTTTGVITWSSPNGSTSYTVFATACDTNNPTNCSSAQSLTLLPTSTVPTLRGNESALNGSYAILYNGYRNSAGGSGNVYGTDIIGSLTFNGSGGVTGVLENISPSSTSAPTPGAVTGYYNLGSDDRGTLIVPVSGGHGLQMAFSVSNFSGSIAQTVRLIEIDDTLSTTGGAGGNIGSGIAKLQTASAFSSSTPLTNPNRPTTFVFGFQGETPCTNYNSLNPNCAQTISNFGPLSAAGEFTVATDGSITGTENAAAVGQSFAFTFTGSYAIDATYGISNGLGGMTLANNGGAYPKAPGSWTYVIVNSGELFMMSRGPHATNSLLSGDVLLQNGNVSFTNTTLNGSYVGYENSAENGDGVSFYPTETSAGLFMLSTINSNTQITINGDQNLAGTIQLNRSQGTQSYYVDSTGCLNLVTTTCASANANALGVGAPIFYLADGTQGFGTEQPSSGSGNGPGLIKVEQQTATSIGTGSLTGTYGTGAIPPPTQVTVTTGSSTISSPGVASTIYDNATTAGVIVLGQSSAYTFSIASNGRGTFTDANGNLSIVYVISPTTAVFIPMNGQDMAPDVIYIQK